MTCGVLSGNRNFEGRIHPLTRANYLASPPLVIAYALAGTVCIDFEKEPLGESRVLLPLGESRVLPLGESRVLPLDKSRVMCIVGRRLLNVPLTPRLHCMFTGVYV